MKYIIRAVKYFFYFCILLAIMLGILVLAHVTDANNLESLFKDGYNSLVKIAIMFGCISAIYPLFGRKMPSSRANTAKSARVSSNSWKAGDTAWNRSRNRI